MKIQGKFIVLDGPDGSGKTTIAKQLVSYLFGLSKTHHMFFTREPYISRYQGEIRKILKEAENPRDHALRLTRLFVQDRKVHARWIAKELRQGHLVVSDRYWHSTLVYQQTQGIPLAELLEMHKSITVSPDLTLLIDIPADVAMRRIDRDNRRSHQEVFEQVEFQKVLREKFRELPEHLPHENIVTINGNRSVEQVCKAVTRAVDKLLR